MAEFKRPRRYYLAKRRAARVLQQNDEQVWQAKQEAEQGTALAGTFPHRAILATLGYTTIEDIDGADADELRRAGLTARQAEDVLGAL